MVVPGSWMWLCCLQTAHPGHRKTTVLLGHWTPCSPVCWENCLQTHLLHTSIQLAFIVRQLLESWSPVFMASLFFRRSAVRCLGLQMLEHSGTPEWLDWVRAGACLLQDPSFFPEQALASISPAPGFSPGLFPAPGTFPCPAPGQCMVRESRWRLSKGLQHQQPLSKSFPSGKRTKSNQSTTTGCRAG